jgi:negative regulator of flagellin synthesis FlgM
MNPIDSAARSPFFPNSKDLKKTQAEEALAADRMKNISAGLRSSNQSLPFDTRDSKVEIPLAVKDFSKIRKQVDMAPSVDNSDKIANLRSQIQSGEYNVDYEGLADKMLSKRF